MHGRRCQLVDDGLLRSGDLNTRGSDGSAASTVVSLAPGVRLSTSGLIDLDGKSFPLDEAGLFVCRLLERPVTIERLIVGVSELREIGMKSAHEGVLPFLDDLNRRGLLSVSQSLIRDGLNRLGALPGLVAQAKFPGAVRRVAPIRRYPGTIGGLIRAVAEAHAPTMWLGVATVLVGVLAVVLLSPTALTIGLGLRAVGLVVGGFYCLLLLNAIVHELSHLVVARVSGSTVFGVYARLGTAGVSFSSEDPRARLAVAIAGPFAALILDVAVAMFIRFSPGEAWAAIGIDRLRLSAVVAALVLGVIQLSCFTPLTKDGRQMLDAVRELARMRRNA